ncbi:MAG: hypothetical protein A2020_15550 [Lentisphaerae bacterium GWF2_45_14]|nr:MAG: hypothetical protein A2020_15550 [Lentisphaerae bacterium GWF2_45_14]
MNGFKKYFMLFLTIIATVIIIAAISLTQREMNKVISENKLTYSDPVKNAPPIVAFTTVALGSFRGLIADLLWLRASALQDEGNYFEMVQLASWITKLQPNFSGATAYLAWNMAYNISVTCSSFADRWRWVSKGIELIRDEALLYNPTDPILYKELGWIYQHKVGNILDDANLYYKNQMAIALMKPFGGAEPNWEALAKAPSSINAFDKKYPAKSPYREALKVSGIESTSALLEYFEDKGTLPAKFTESIANPAGLRKIIYFLRAEWLREKFKLDPSLIVVINKRYGALDWRLPETQAIYWATLGLEKCPEKADISLERMITQALKDSFMSGRLLMIDAKNYENVITVPNLKVVDSVLATFQKAYEKNKNKSFLSAKENFTKDAIVVLYTFGGYTKAQEYLDMLKKEFPDNREYKMGLDHLVMKEWSEDVKSATMKQANDIISGLLFRSCYYLVYGDTTAYESHEKLARLVYARYQRDQAGTEKRTGLAPFNEIKTNIIKTCLKNFPPEIAKILETQIKSQQKEAKEELGISDKASPPPKTP